VAGVGAGIGAEKDPALYGRWRGSRAAARGPRPSRGRPPRRGLHPPEPDGINELGARKARRTSTTSPGEDEHGQNELEQRLGTSAATNKCHCGSGKKYKHCHRAEDEAALLAFRKEDEAKREAEDAAAAAAAAKEEKAGAKAARSTPTSTRPPSSSPRPRPTGMPARRR